jgi:hypothetical protein
MAVLTGWDQMASGASDNTGPTVLACDAPHFLPQGGGIDPGDTARTGATADTGITGDSVRGLIGRM